MLRHGVTHEKVFALTFDDGPHPLYTPQVLAILNAAQVPATFFMVGKMVRAHPAQARMVLAQGYVVGNHTWSHPSKTRSPGHEVRATDAVIERVLGVTPTLFRPPYGLMNNGLAKVAEADKKIVVLWSAVGADWSHRATPGSIASRIIKEARPGGIALLHDGGGNRSATVAALPRIIGELRAHGYRFVTVPQLLAMSRPPS
jgi:chitin deacetylase